MEIDARNERMCVQNSRPEVDVKTYKLDPYKTTLQYPSPNMNPKTTNNANGPEDGAGSQLSDDREDERR